MKIRLSFLLLVLLCVGLNPNKVSAQVTTTNCFDIQSILVDACGNPEGDNEMVRFLVGPNPLNTSNLTNINWSTAGIGYTGICENTASANAVAALNATILGCGKILEPVGGVLPANSTVILATSPNISSSANSFANLNDTIYMIFPCTLATIGHFGNWTANPGSVKNFSMSFVGACSDAVSYDSHLLINQSGGSSAQDGATVIYDFAGNATYTNTGCQAPIIPLQASLSSTVGSTSVCPGASINISAVITSGNYYSFFWKNGHGTYGNTTALNTTYTTDPNYTGVDDLVFAIVTNCNDTVFDTLNIALLSITPASLTANGPTTFCRGDSVILTASGSGTYLWSTGATTNSITALTSNTYSITATSTCGVTTANEVVTVDTLTPASITANGPTSFCVGNSVTLSTAIPGTYEWSTGATTNSITVSTANTYSVTITELCGITSTSQVVDVSTTIPTTVITASGSTTICQGTSVTLTASGASNYLWSTGETTSSIIVSQAGNYTVSGINPCGSSNAGTTISVTPLPLAVITPVGGITHFCTGGSVTLLASGGTSYLWSNGNTTNTINVTTGGSYTVTAINSCGSNSISQLTVETSTPVTTLAVNSMIICPGAKVTLTATGTATDYIWSTGETGNAITVSTAGNYTVASTNSCGSDLDSIQLTSSNLIAGFTSDTTAGSAQATIHFTNTSLFASTYQWDFGDGLFSADTNTSHTYLNEGHYHVVLMATDTTGCTDKASETITIIDDNAAWVPNIFTPNGDQKNDVFAVVGKGITQLSARIFNRWGIEVFSWSSLQSGWNGMYAGADAPEGVYYYLIKVKYDTGKRAELKGTLTLMR